MIDINDGRILREELDNATERKMRKQLEEFQKSGKQATMGTIAQKIGKVRPAIAKERKR